MKKEEFAKLGIDEETAAKCEVASSEEMKNFIPKARFDEVNNEKKKLELDMRERDSQLETLKNSTGDVEGMKAQIETLQADNKTKDEQHAAQIKQLKIDAAVTAALTAAKAKNTTAAKALLGIDLEKVEFNEDGSIKGLDETLAKLKTDESSKFLFDADAKKPKMRGAETGDGKDNEPTIVTREQFDKMTYRERSTLFENDKELYDSLVN